MLIYNGRVDTINTIEAHSDLSRMILMLLTWWGGEKYGNG